MEAETTAGGNGDELRAYAEEFRSMSTVLSRLESMGTLFRRFNDRRRFNDEYGYLETLTPSDYRQAYDRYSIAARIVDLPAHDTWREPPDVYEDEDPAIQTPFEIAWKTLVDRLRLWHYFERLDIVAGLGRYAVMLLDTTGTGKLSEPLRPGDESSLVGLSIFAEDHAQILSLEANQSSPRFNLPLIYQLDFTAEQTGYSSTPILSAATPRSAGTSTQVHWTRIIHFADGLLEDDVYGRPRLKPVFNRLDDLEKVLGGSAESFFQRAAQHLAFMMDPAFKPPNAAVVADMKDQIEEFQHRIRRVLRLWGMDVKNIAPAIADPRGTLQGICSVIAGGTGIPQRLLFGSERGDLASQQDRSNWADRVKRRQTKIAEPLAIRPFIERCLEYKFLPKPKSYTVRWPMVQVLTEGERAEVVQRRASAARFYAEQGSAAFPHIIVAPSEAREELGYPAQLPADAPPSFVQPLPQPKPAPVSAPKQEGEM